MAEKNLAEATTATHEIPVKEMLDFEKPYDLIVSKLSDWIGKGMEVFPNFLAALMILAIFVFLSSIVGRLAHRVFEWEFHSKTTAGVLTMIIKLLIISLGLFSALAILGLHKTVISILAGAGIVGIVIGIGFQDIALNLGSGLILGVKKPFKMNDLIEVGGYFGYARKFHLINTAIETRDGHMVTIPNKLILQGPLINYCTTGMMRIKVKVGVSYGEDLEFVEQTIREAIEKLEFIAKGKPIDVFALEYGESSVNFSARYWIPFPHGGMGFREAEHAGILAIRKAFRERGITIPFPIRTLDFGIKGGKELSEEELKVIKADGKKKSA